MEISYFLKKIAIFEFCRVIRINSGHRDIRSIGFHLDLSDMQRFQKQKLH